MGMIGPQEILILVIAAFLLYGGGKKIPELARSLGRAKGEFHQGLADSREMSPEDDLERGGRTEEAALAEDASTAGIDVEGKSPDDVAKELEDE
jgi:sec-independent protein translocase protein TatA